MSGPWVLLGLGWAWSRLSTSTTRVCHVRSVCYLDLSTSVSNGDVHWRLRVQVVLVDGVGSLVAVHVAWASDTCMSVGSTSLPLLMCDGDSGGRSGPVLPREALVVCLSAKQCAARHTAQMNASWSVCQPGNARSDTQPR
jgi:hypothetical protein